MKNISLTFLCFFFISCEKEECRVCSDGVTRCGNEYDEWINSSKLTPLDNLFINGFQMKLEQIYVMNDQNSVPFYDTPVDSLFNQPNTISNLPNYHYDNYDGNYILYSLKQGEVWNVSKMYQDSIVEYIEHGFGSDYTITKQVRYCDYNLINCKNEYVDRRFYFPIKLNDIYNYRGHDNHVLNIKVLDEKGKLLDSNLKFDILTKDGNALFDKNWIYFDTNKQYNIGYTISAPLTSNQVKQIINSGTGFELYIQNGITYYKINENLYIPRYGDSYVYAGTTNQNGMLNYYVCSYYRLKFKII